MIGFNSMLAEIEQRDDRLLVAKNAAEKAAAVNAQLARESALILNSATDGIIGVDLDNRSTFSIRRRERMLGMTLERTARKIDPRSHPSLARRWNAVAGSGLSATRWPCVAANCSQLTADTFWRADGTSFPVEYSATTDARRGRQPSAARS